MSNKEKYSKLLRELKKLEYKTNEVFNTAFTKFFFKRIDDDISLQIHVNVDETVEIEYSGVSISCDIQIQEDITRIQEAYNKLQLELMVLNNSLS